MSFDDIPYKSHSNTISKGLPEILILGIKKYKTNVIDNSEKEIKKLVDIRNQNIILFENEVNYAYEVLSYGLKNNDHYRVELSGKQSDIYNEPSLDRWKRDNPGKYLVIEYFIEQFKFRGWNPYLRLSSYRYEIYRFMDKPAEYIGGDKVILECQFK